MRVDRQSADISTESRPTYRPSIGRYIGRLSVNISADTRSTDALSTHDPEFLLRNVGQRRSHVPIRFRVEWKLV